MIGIICFLIVIVLVNILTYSVSSPIFQSGVNLINENFWLLVLVAIILFVADIFEAFSFPLNLPAPIVKAAGCVFCIAFILHVFQWVDSIAFTNLYQTFWLISFLVVPLVFLIVLVGGYFEILRQLSWQPKVGSQMDSQVVRQGPEPEKDQLADAKSWEEIGAEFRIMLFDIIPGFRQEVNKKK